MGIIEELLKEIKDSEIDIKVKKICDKIQEEENEEITDKDIMPKGANVFLSLQVKKLDKEIFFITLERESPETYFIGLYFKKRDRKTALKRVKYWDVKYSKPERILREFGKMFKFIQGDNFNGKNY